MSNHKKKLPTKDVTPHPQGERDYIPTMAPIIDADAKQREGKKTLPLTSGTVSYEKWQVKIGGAWVAVKLEKDLKRRFHEKCIREGVTMEAKVGEWVETWVNGWRRG